MAEANLEDFANAGFFIGGYINANPWYDIDVCLENARLNAGGMWDILTVVAVDVELDGIIEADIKDMCAAVRSAGKKDPIYSAAWFWRDRLGNPVWPWLKEHKIWEAYYDSDPDIDFLSRRFGPWELADVCGEQYQGTTKIDGVAVDLNLFDLSYWQENDMFTDEDRATLLNIRERTRKALVKPAGKPEVYEYNEDEGVLVHQVGLEVFSDTRHSFDDVKELPTDHPIWNLKAVYPAGVPPELRAP